MAGTRKGQQLDLRLHLAHSLLADGALSKVDHLLRELLPCWSRDLRVRLDVRSRSWFSACKRGSLPAAVRRLIRPGQTYASLLEQYGPGRYARQTGHATLTGGYSGVYVFLSLDEWLFMPQPGRQLFGNTISIQVSRETVEGTVAAEWLSCAVARLCEDLDLLYGFAAANREYYSKNKEGWRMMGLDPSRYLPGLYWMNVFGRPYVKLIGRRHLMGLPGTIPRQAGAGVLVQFGNDPFAWRSQNYKVATARALDHIGRRYFFDRHARKRQTIAPPFHFESKRLDHGKPPQKGGTLTVEFR